MKCVRHRAKRMLCGSFCKSIMCDIMLTCMQFEHGSIMYIQRSTCTCVGYTSMHIMCTCIVPVWGTHSWGMTGNIICARTFCCGTSTSCHTENSPVCQLLRHEVLLLFMLEIVHAICKKIRNSQSRMAVMIQHDHGRGLQFPFQLTGDGNLVHGLQGLMQELSQCMEDRDKIFMLHLLNNLD